MIGKNGIENNSDFVRALYNCVIDESVFAEITNALNNINPAGYATILLANAHNENASLVFYSGGSTELAEAYSSYYCYLDPTRHGYYAPGARHDMRTGLDLDAFKKSEFYNDLLLPLNGGGHWSFCPLNHTGTSALSVGFHYRDTYEVEKTISKILDDMAPHLPVVHEVLQSRIRREWITFEDLIDSFAVPVVACTRTGDIVIANKLAEGIILADATSSLRPLGPRTLRIAGSDSFERAIVDMIAKDDAVRLVTERTSRGQIITGRCVRHYHTHGPVERWTRAQIGIPTVDVLVYLKCTGAVRGELFWEACRAYKLTRAEQEVVSGLVAAQTIDEIAGARGLSRNTVRNQLSSVMEKTETKRQAEVVALFSAFI